MTSEQCNILLGLLIASLALQAFTLIATVFYSDALLKQARESNKPSPQAETLRDLQDWTRDLMERVVDLKSLSVGRESSLGTAAVMRQRHLGRTSPTPPPPPDVPEGGAYRVISTG